MKAQNNICIIISLIIILSAFIGNQNVECEECRLWSFITNQGFTIYDNRIFAGQHLAELYYQGYNQPNGWSLLYYDVNCNVARVEHSNVPPNQSQDQWYDMVVYMTHNPTHGSFLALGHLRTASNSLPGGGYPLDPHPFIWETDNGDWTFAHNGYVDKYQLANILAFRNWVNNLGIPNVPNTFGVPGNWWDPGVLQYVIDTELYFLFIIYHTELAGGDIFMGINNALQADELGTYTKNFTFANGESIIAYKDGFYDLYYYDDPDAPSLNFKAVMTTTPSGQTWIPMGNDDLVYLQRNCDAVVFSDFATDYLFVHYLEGGESIRWNWVSFPVLPNPAGTNALDVLEPILDPDVLEEVVYEDQPVIYYDFTPPNPHWVNYLEDGNFRSIDGYKIKMHTDAELEIAGVREDPGTVIHLYAEDDKSTGFQTGRENWIGYFLPNSQIPQMSFSQIWDKLIFIKADMWAMFKKPDGSWWGNMPIGGQTVDYGKLYIVGVSEDCSFTWGIPVEPIDPYTKPESELFTYEEQADYMPIFVDSTEALNGIDEIGVFLEDECISASKIEGFPVFIPAYIEEDSTGSKDYNELTFQVASYGKGGKRSIPAFVYNETQNSFVEEPVILDAKSYAIVRLGTGAGTEFPKEFTLYQNYPNPVKGSTTISFSLPENTEKVEILIYNIKGQLVKNLGVPGYELRVGKAVWDGKDNNGNQLASGIYFYKLISGEKTAVKKMILLR
ncbi:MAG: T9SS type A sorting domain-containing protein [Candidatus Cloacimonetes bacterium]|nr:T9SS type A sorting domain-containing protein [Candidatus Cloacimonadota bacterium]